MFVKTGLAIKLRKACVQSALGRLPAFLMTLEGPCSCRMAANRISVLATFN